MAFLVAIGSSSRTRCGAQVVVDQSGMAECWAAMLRITYGLAIYRSQPAIAGLIS
jgi:hypothetical protein